MMKNSGYDPTNFFWEKHKELFFSIFKIIALAIFANVFFVY